MKNVPTAIRVGRTTRLRRQGFSLIELMDLNNPSFPDNWDPKHLQQSLLWDSLRRACILGCSIAGAAFLPLP